MENEKVVSFGQAVADIINADKWFLQSIHKNNFDSFLQKRFSANYAENKAYEISGSKVELLNSYRESYYFAAAKVLNNNVTDDEAEKIDKIMDTLDSSITVQKPSIKQTFKNVATGKFANIVYGLQF